jgi:hypothetical protein
MNTGSHNQKITDSQPGKGGDTCIASLDEPKVVPPKPAWPGVLHAMCKKGLSESGVSAESIEEDWFNGNNQLEYIQALLDEADKEFQGLSGKAAGNASVPAIDLLSKNCLPSIARYIALNAKAAIGLMIVTKAGKMIQFADYGLPTSTASSERELLKKVAKESALKLVPRMSSSILATLAQLQEEKLLQEAKTATPPPDEMAQSIDPKEPSQEELQPVAVETSTAVESAPESVPELTEKKQPLRFAGSVFLNQLSEAIDVPLMSVPFRLEDSSGVLVLLVETRPKDEPAPPIDQFLTGMEQLWMSKSMKASLLRQLDAWYFLHRANVFMRTMGAIDWIRSQPRLWSSLLGLACVLLIAPVPYYPRRECVFEPESKQFLSSPMQGRIASCDVRPGDNVTSGQLLAKLDDDQLQRDLAAARADFDGAEKKRDTALATRAAGNAGIADIEMEQARLKIVSLEEQLKRLEIRATKDGVVVQGDWHRNIGMPVTLGQSLFEVAELETMTAEVRLNAYDLEQINVGDEVSVRSDASGGETFRGRISRIEPRATILDDAAVFIADVVIRDPQLMLRPGMKATAQITAGWKPIGWLLFVRPYRWIANQWIW